jgi:hypothetical protein
MHWQGHDHAYFPPKNFMEANTNMKVPLGPGATIELTQKLIAALKEQDA